MRIMLVSSTYEPAMNGQAVFTTNLAEGMEIRGHQVMVVLDSHHAHPSLTTFNDVEIVELPSINLNTIHAGVYFSPFPGVEVKRLLQSFQPDIVHIQDHYPVCRAAVHLARKYRLKIVGSNHFIPDNLAPYIPGLSKIKPLFNWILWQWMVGVYKYVDVITAQSVAAVKLIQQQHLTMPILPISCGIDLLRYQPRSNYDVQLVRHKYGIAPDRKIFLFLGRIDGEKRIDLLIRAMQQIPRDDTQMVIAGHGAMEGSLRQLAMDMNLGEKVHFTGFIPSEDVPGLMNSVDLFTMPSEAELLSISTLEAMACGRPVLLANALALPELVRVGENGFLFNPGDVNDLAYRINDLADHPSLWASMGKVSREIASAHSLETTLDKFELVYSQLVAQGSVRDVKLELRTPA